MATTATRQTTLRPLSDFLTEDPNVYSQEEIRDMLDMIHIESNPEQTERLETHLGAKVEA
jgi:hypothetical protein